MIELLPKQLSHIASARREIFVDQLESHFATNFAFLWEPFSPGHLRIAIRYGIQLAESLGFTSKRETCLFVALSFVFGPAFHSEQDWAVGFLETSAGEGCIDKLYQAGIDRESSSEQPPAELVRSQWRMIVDQANPP